MKPGAKYLLSVALTVLLAVGAAAAYKYLTSVTTVPPSQPPAGGRIGAPGNTRKQECGSGFHRDRRRRRNDVGRRTDGGKQIGRRA